MVRQLRRSGDARTREAGAAVSRPAAAKQWTPRVYRIEIDGIARVKGRPRLGRGGNTYTPTNTKTWEELVAWTFAKAHGTPKLEGPVRVTMWFHQRLGDIDNLAKAILDGLNGVAYKDDSQVVDIRARKEWGEGRGRRKAWTEITVEEITRE